MWRDPDDPELGWHAGLRAFPAALAMSGHDIVVSLLLALGIGRELLCCLAVLIMPNIYARLHYLGPALIFGAFMIAVAVLAEEGSPNGGIKTLLIVAVMMVASPVITHATASGIHSRNTRHLPTDADRDESALQQRCNSCS
jgi:monovalent cation/proton antiporter MnhG/PhaG subunit